MKPAVAHRLAVLILIPAAAAAALPARAQSAADAAPLPGADWSLHAQATYNLQGHGAFTAPYAGDNSFESRKETRGSFTATLFLGRRLWRGGELYANAELEAGEGVSKVLGLAGPPNGETYRVDSPTAKFSLARFFLRQRFDSGGSREAVEDDDNQLAGSRARRGLVLTLGKFSGTDLFDGNRFAHDPRTQFNNWSLWANGAWDYPADTRGYTWGAALEWNHDDWAARLGAFMVPREANQMALDPDWRRAHGLVLELERDYALAGKAGALRLIAFDNRARMGNYRAALAQSPAAPDVIATRRPGARKYGWGINLEQALTDRLGFFARAGWNDGATESWAFTEIERTFTAGFSCDGAAWRRPGDRLALAWARNGLGDAHRDYLAAGGYGFMLGDGRLNYSPERLLAILYSVRLARWGALSLEAQRYENPAANADRGPLTVYGVRLHLHD